MRENRKQRYKALLNNKTHVRPAYCLIVAIQYLFIKSFSGELLRAEYKAVDWDYISVGKMWRWGPNLYFSSSSFLYRLPVDKTEREAAGTESVHTEGRCVDT